MDILTTPEDPEPQPTSESLTIEEVAGYLENQELLISSWVAHLKEVVRERCKLCPSIQCEHLKLEVAETKRRIRAMQFEARLARTAMRYLTEDSQGGGV